MGNDFVVSPHPQLYITTTVNRNRRLCGVGHVANIRVNTRRHGSEPSPLRNSTRAKIEEVIIVPRFPRGVRSNLLDRRALGQRDGGAAASCLVKSSERKWVHPDVIPDVMDHDPHLRILNKVNKLTYASRHKTKTELSISSDNLGHILSSLLLIMSAASTPSAASTLR